MWENHLERYTHKHYYKYLIYRRPFVFANISLNIHTYQRGWEGEDEDGEKNYYTRVKSRPPSFIFLSVLYLPVNLPPYNLIKI